MAKTKEELDALKEEIEAVNEKLSELTDEEIAQVSGGVDPVIDRPAGERTGDWGVPIVF